MAARGSGRTTRLLVRAIDFALEGHDVVFYVDRVAMIEHTRRVLLRMSNIMIWVHPPVSKILVGGMGSICIECATQPIDDYGMVTLYDHHNPEFLK